MRHKVEVFSAGCKLCDDTVRLVTRLRGDHEIIIHDMRDDATVQRAAAYGVRSVPAVVVDGTLASCCVGNGPQEGTIQRLLGS